MSSGVATHSPHENPSHKESKSQWFEKKASSSVTGQTPDLLASRSAIPNGLLCNILDPLPQHERLLHAAAGSPELDEAAVVYDTIN